MSLFEKFFRPVSQSEQEAQASSSTLDRLKERRGQETGKWLSLMVDTTKRIKTGPPPTIEDVDRRDVITEAPYTPPMETQFSPYLEDVAQASQAKLSAVAMNPTNAPAASPVPNDDNETTLLVNRFFSEFSNLSGEFNATASGTDLVVSVQLPEITYESAHYGEAYDEHKKVELFKGHLSTAHWAMLVQGTEGKIEVYMIAADQILNFTLNDIRKSQLSPFMKISSQKIDGHLRWNIDGQDIPAESFPLLAKELFGDLVRISSGTMVESELFAQHDKPLRLGETVAQGYENLQSQAASAPAAAVAAPVVRQGEQAGAGDVKTLPTWEACRKLIDTLDRDLAWVGERQNSVEASSDEGVQLHKLGAQLRTLSGQISIFIAENNPSTEPKYRAS